MRRFIVQPEVQGGHEHHIERKLQNSALTAWKKLPKKMATLMGVGRGPNSVPELVEKYGECQGVVGSGASAVVHLSHKMACSGSAPKVFAIKQFKRRRGKATDVHNYRLATEFYISRELRYQNVIQTLDLLKDTDGNLYGVMEFCAGGDLFTLVQGAGRLEVQEADCFFKQLMNGIQYIHEMGVAHRDLKPENLLLSSRGKLKLRFMKRAATKSRIIRTLRSEIISGMPTGLTSRVRRTKASARSKPLTSEVLFNLSHSKDTQMIS